MEAPSHFLMPCSKHLSHLDIPELYSFMCVCVLVTQLFPTPRDPMDLTAPGSPIHGILQARILEWVAISSSRNTLV